MRVMVSPQCRPACKTIRPFIWDSKILLLVCPTEPTACFFFAKLYRKHRQSAGCQEGNRIKEHWLCLTILKITARLSRHRRDAVPRTTASVQAVPATFTSNDEHIQGGRANSTRHQKNPKLHVVQTVASGRVAAVISSPRRPPNARTPAGQTISDRPMD